jgi:flagellar hook-associated protein 3 FlgL
LAVNIRVTAQTQTNNAIAYLRREGTNLAKYNDQLGSGLRVKAASDDPTNYPALLQAKASSGRFATYTQTVSDATSDLDAGVSALNDINDALTRAKQIAVEGADATTDAAGQAALATEVDSLINRVMQSANSKNGDAYLFGGTATETAPFQVTATDAQGNPTAISYTGSANRARTLTGPGQTVDTKYVGSQVFQQSGADVFQALIGLRDLLRSAAPTTAKAQQLSQQIGVVDAARSALTDTTGEQSANLAAMDGIKNRLTDLKLAADGRATDLESTDYAEAVLKMNEQQSDLQATMSVAAKLLQPSLLNFIQ